MATFPTISYSQVAKYPLARTLAWSTKVNRFLNDQEQRFVSQTPKEQFTLKFMGVNQTDFNTLYTFWTSMHGADENVFDLNLGTDPVNGVSMHYFNLVFVNDDFIATQMKPNLWNITFQLRATMVDTYQTATAASFPKINGGQIVSQRPYATAPAFLHATNEMPCGVRYAYSYRTNPLRTWTLNYPHIPTSDVLTLEKFFNAMGGRYGYFTFTDLADGSVHNFVRFDQDKFTVQYNGINDCDLTLKLAEFAS